MNRQTLIRRRPKQLNFGDFINKLSVGTKVSVYDKNAMLLREFTTTELKEKMWEIESLNPQYTIKLRGQKRFLTIDSWQLDKDVIKITLDGFVDY